MGNPGQRAQDNGAVFTGKQRGGGRVALEVELGRLGVRFDHSRPYHPQTCGKVERFHQTLKAFLDRQPRAHSMAELQAQIDRFVAYYNGTRPHRARGRITPQVAFEGRDKARPAGPKIRVGPGVRVRRDRIDSSGKLSLRQGGKLHHIGVGRDYRNRRVIMLIAGLDIRVVTEDGELLRHLTLDPTKNYQGTGRPPGPPKGRPLGPRKKKLSIMS